MINTYNNKYYNKYQMINEDKFTSSYRRGNRFFFFFSFFFFSKVDLKQEVM